MGKKGKRSKQKDARTEADKIIRESDKLLAFVFKDVREMLYSKVVKQLREIIRLLESKKELMIYTRDRHSRACRYLMSLEYRRRNYKEAIDCYNHHMAKSRDKNFRVVVSIYYQITMMKLNGQECNLSDMIQEISGVKNAENFPFYEAVYAFRVHKMYETAIRLDMTCGSIIWSPLKKKLSLALTYLEQYRLEFRQRSQTRKEDIQRIKSLVHSLMTEYPFSEDNATSEYYMVLAQWYYLSQNIFPKEKSIISASMFIDYFFAEKKGKNGNKLRQDRCHTCDQAVTPTDVQFVCSGCRVACYCSIDHQRATWKMEAVEGMRIGHEILCPLYKAFRKYEFQRASKDRDEEKESKAKRRLDRECVRFLAEGLGLKDKCFPCEYKK
ncbi:predicted protein [Chaetoceros tenuissimus]|uniref:MYND-type domain-containing protein n=1 Tax=Chaetoceros tenuissimus TaxID=426638 RepID=A0AAD3HFE8_9STRA|nr:predicted protein [Chaetoceros tenuissimus]